MNVPKEALQEIEEALYTAYDRLDMIDPDGTQKDWDESEQAWFGVAVEKEEVSKALNKVRNLLKETA